MRFEYKTLTTRDNRQLSGSQLNEWGSQGWELVSVLTHGSKLALRWHYVLKRAVDPDKP